jgi:hypothetical protein
LNEDGFEMIVLGPSIPENGYGQLEETAFAKNICNPSLSRFNRGLTIAARRPIRSGNWDVQPIAHSDRNAFQS